MTNRKHFRPVLTIERAAAIETARRILLMLEAEFGYRGGIAGDAGTARRAIARLQDADRRARRAAGEAIAPESESELRAAWGDR